MQALIKSVVEELSYFHPWPDAEGTVAIPYVWDPGEVPLCLVLGPNGGGKSFFRRLITLVAREDWKGVECIHLSMEARAGSLMYGPARSLVYGDEGRSSTGELSGNVVLTGIRTCQKRSRSHLIYWDEPDVGMGEDEAAGTGQVLREFMSNLPEHTRCVFITSHSRALVRELASLRPHFLYLGEDPHKAPQNLAEWLSKPIHPVHPETLRTAALDRFRAIQAILNSEGRGRK